MCPGSSGDQRPATACKAPEGALRSRVRMPVDAFERIRVALPPAVNDLSAEKLAFSPDSEPNSIGWLVVRDGWTPGGALRVSAGVPPSLPGASDHPLCRHRGRALAADHPRARPS